MHVLNGVFGMKDSSAKYSGGSPGASQKLHTIETISKKRTRKITKRDPWGETQFTNLEEDDDDKKDEIEMSPRIVHAKPQLKHRFSKENGQQSGTWKPDEDEDEMCLTTTTIRGKEGRKVDEERLESGMGMEAISGQREFAWGENK